MVFKYLYKRGDKKYAKVCDQQDQDHISTTSFEIINAASAPENTPKVQCNQYVMSNECLRLKLRGVSKVECKVEFMKLNVMGE